MASVRLPLGLGRGLVLGPQLALPEPAVAPDGSIAGGLAEKFPQVWKPALRNLVHPNVDLAYAQLLDQVEANLQLRVGERRAVLRVQPQPDLVDVRRPKIVLTAASSPVRHRSDGSGGGEVWRTKSSMSSRVKRLVQLE